MAVVLSTDLDEVKIQARGNWFTFQPGKAKVMDDGLAHFLCTDKSYLGFIGLPEICVDDPSSAEAKALKEDATKRGRANIVNHLNKVINNLEISLQRDLDIAGIKADATRFASDGEMKAYKKLATLKAEQDRDDEKRSDEIKKLKGQISGNTDKPDARKTN
jgi:hypothetical protein